MNNKIHKPLFFLWHLDCICSTLSWNYLFFFALDRIKIKLLREQIIQRFNLQQYVITITHSKNALLVVWYLMKVFINPWSVIFLPWIFMQLFMFCEIYSHPHSIFATCNFWLLYLMPQRQDLDFPRNTPNTERQLTNQQEDLGKRKLNTQR